MAKITINDRTAELILSMASWEEMEEAVGTLDEFDDLMTGRQRLRNMRMCAEILAREGARQGKGDELPADWLKENMQPAEVRLLGAALRLAITEGMRMQTKQGEDQATDRILAQIEKKEGQDA